MMIEDRKSYLPVISCYSAFGNGELASMIMQGYFDTFMKDGYDDDYYLAPPIFDLTKLSPPKHILGYVTFSKIFKCTE